MSNQLERVKYRKSALREVVFQVRFPSILKIDAEIPSEFQEAVRQKYPLFTDRLNETSVNINGQEQTIIKNHNYEFVSADGKTKVNLTSSFLAVSTLDYDRWEVFKSDCETVYEILLRVYRPSVTQRIGLRYKDLITRSLWNLQHLSWKELIKEHELGVLAELPEDKVNRYSFDIEIASEDNVIEHRHFELVRDQQTPLENSFLIDCDYFTQGIIPCDIVFQSAEPLHDHSSNFIRSIITDALNTAMEPETI